MSTVEPDSSGCTHSQQVIFDHNLERRSLDMDSRRTGCREVTAISAAVDTDIPLPHVTPPCLSTSIQLADNLEVASARQSHTTYFQSVHLTLGVNDSKAFSIQADRTKSIRLATDDNGAPSS